MNGAVHSGTSVSNYVLQMLAAADDQNILRDTPIESTTPYVYSTSSHYPPGILGVRNNEPSTRSSFQYETSSQYPVTVETPTTTTIRHFSFGNLDNSTNEEPAVLYDSAPQEAPPTLNYSTTFAYSTSSVMPPVEPIETTTLRHFSNGNLENTTAQSPAVQRGMITVILIFFE